MPGKLIRQLKSAFVSTGGRRLERVARKQRFVGLTDISCHRAGFTRPIYRMAAHHFTGCVLVPEHP